MGGYRREDFTKLARRQRGIITRDQLRQCNYSDRQIDHLVRLGGLERIQPRTFRIGGAPPSWEQDVMAAILSVGDGWVAALRSAARLWELDGCVSRAIDLLGGRSAPRNRRGVCLHETDFLPVGHRATVRGIPTTDISRTLIELGRVSSIDTVEGALECAVRRGYASFDYIERKLSEFRGPGRRGSAVLAEIFKIRRGRPTESPLETDLFQVPRRGRLPLPERQVAVYDDSGIFIARPDFLYRAQRVGIEGFSRKHHGGWQDVDADRLRRNRLTAAGYRVLEFTHEQVVKTPTFVVDEVAKALGARLF